MNRGREAARLHILPQLWARNIWSWKPGIEKPFLRKDGGSEILVIHPQMPAMRLICGGLPELLFCDNESNSGRLWGHKTKGYFKDGINDYVAQGKHDAINPEAVGTKAAAHYPLIVAGGGSVRLQLRLRPDNASGGLDDFDAVLQRRRDEADEF